MHRRVMKEGLWLSCGIFDTGSSARTTPQGWKRASMAMCWKSEQDNSEIGMPTALQTPAKGWKCLFGSTGRRVGKNSRECNLCSSARSYQQAGWNKKFLTYPLMYLAVSACIHHLSCYMATGSSLMRNHYQPCNPFLYRLLETCSWITLSYLLQNPQWVCPARLSTQLQKTLNRKNKAWSHCQGRQRERHRDARASTRGRVGWAG